MVVEFTYVVHLSQNMSYYIEEVVPLFSGGIASSSGGIFSHTFTMIQRTISYAIHLLNRVAVLIM